MESVKERLITFIGSLGIGQAKFERQCGLANGYVNNIRRSVTPEKLQKIAQEYPALNTVWLLTGEGEMLKTSTEQTETTPYTVPLVPISAQGGSFNDFVVSVKDSDCEKVISPVRQVDFALTVTGDSMAPEYPGGSQVLVRKVNERAFIEWGRVYVLDTCNGTVIKKLNPGRDDDEVLCVSVNPDYQPFYVKLSDVYGLYRVMMCMTLK